MLRFDEALGAAISELGDCTAETTVVRDPSGSLTIVLPDSALAPEEWEPVAARLHERLERFSPGETRVLLRQSDLIVPEEVLESPDRIRLPGTKSTWLVDRLLTNQDWLRAPICESAPLPIGTAFSIKGGVGRSTALAVLAWYLARLGRSVLVVDLDLEAPGIGTMLIRERDLPDYGVVDWCVESLSGRADAGLLQRSLATASIGETEGTVTVIPALGRSTRDYVAKLGRAYLPVLDQETGKTQGLADRLMSLTLAVRELLEPPEVVLFDARAGLHDIGSAAVTQLGAEVFLFARDDAQTWEAYRRLFEHLRLARSVVWGMPDQDLRWRLKMVAAQANPAVGAMDAWIDRSYSTWTSFYDGPRPEDEPGDSAAPARIEPGAFERKEKSAPHYPLRITFDQNLMGMNFVDERARPDWSFIELAFGSFLEGAAERLLPQTPGEST
jgi:hypothetical protein